MLPSITTNNISNITSNSAETGGVIYDEGGSEVIARGVCYSSSPNPTLDDNFTLNNAGSGDFTSIITNLNGNSDYYVRAYATNSFGTNYGSQKFFATLQQPTVNIGEPYQGGIVAYIFQPEDPGYVVGETHGIIVSSQDIAYTTWYPPNSLVTGTTGYEIGTGAANTTTIINFVGDENQNCAALKCVLYDFGGYYDWFLPSLNELMKVYENKGEIGGLSNGYYWTSTKDGLSGDYARIVGFSIGDAFSTPSLNTNAVRACRYF